MKIQDFRSMLDCGTKDLGRFIRGRENVQWKLVRRNDGRYFVYDEADMVYIKATGGLGFYDLQNFNSDYLPIEGEDK